MTRPIDGRPVTEVVVGDKTLDVVDEFCYLGDTLSSGGDCTSAIINRCKVAWGKLRKSLLILTPRNLPFLGLSRVYNVQFLCASYYALWWQNFGPK